jgi:hypothetical protein
LVYELQPSGGGWSETVIYAPTTNLEGNYPYGGVIFDHSGNLFGVLMSGGSHNCGTAYELSPAGSGWTSQVINNFAGGLEGCNPDTSLIMDSTGNLYGTSGGLLAGITFELVRGRSSWNFDALAYSAGDLGGLAMDTAGNLYGTTFSTPTNYYGAIFKLTRSGGSWNYTSLHEFSGSDGGNPSGQLFLDTNGNLFGTAGDGTYGNGVVWEITP